MKPEAGTKPRVYYRNLWRYIEMLHRRQRRERSGRRGRLRRGRERAPAQGRRRRSRRATTDNYGDFKFDRLDENSGRYTIEVSANGKKQTVDAELGASISLGEIRL